MRNIPLDEWEEDLSPLFVRTMFGFKTSLRPPFYSEVEFLEGLCFRTSSNVPVSARGEDTSFCTARNAFFVGWEDEDPCNARFCLLVIRGQWTKDMKWRLGLYSWSLKIYDSDIIILWLEWLEFYGSGSMLQILTQWMTAVIEMETSSDLWRYHVGVRIMKVISW